LGKRIDEAAEIHLCNQPLRRLHSNLPLPEATLTYGPLRLVFPSIAAM